MATRIRFFGVASYEIITSQGQHILCDPFFDENPGSPVRSDSFERVDLIIVSHGTFDHLGDTEVIARRTGAPVICGGEVKAYLTERGLPEGQIRATIWGIAVQVNGIKVQPVECHHWSPLRMPSGNYVVGLPLSYIVYADPGVRFYHYGDTALFSDLKLIAELYRPNIGCIGITQPREILHRVSGPGEVLTGEMSPREGVMAAQWLGLDTVLPCHYINPDCPEVHEFVSLMAAAKQRGETVPREVRVMAPGDELIFDPPPDTYTGGPT